MAQGSATIEKPGQRATDEPAVLRSYGCGALRFAGTPDALIERHLKSDNVVALDEADAREHYEATARAVRDILTDRWLETDATYRRENPKRVYYMSIEFLIGRSLANNVMNLMLDPVVSKTFNEHGRVWMELLDQEPDAGLGNGGLGRLAACFLELDGDDGAAGVGLRSALRARHLPAGAPQRLAGREARQLAHAPRSLGGCAPARTGRGQVRLHHEIARRKPPPDPEPAFDADRLALRPSCRRIWREDDQHATPMERVGRTFLRLPALQRRRLRRLDGRDARRGIADPRALSR